MKIKPWKVTSSNSLPVGSAHAKRVLFFSDVHLLHKQTPTSVIIYNLWLLIQYVTTTPLDAIYILGDLFDERDTLENEDLIESIGFLNDLLELCKEKNIALRVLEGTPKHDRKQSKVIIELNKKYNVDLMYVDDLSIYRDNVLDMVVGMIPDEYRDDASETTKLFKGLMKSKGYDSVDIMGMHGLFDFQIPHIQSKANFNAHVWDRIVRYAIMIGHDHNPKQRGKIRITGSPDCLSHGEVGTKGVTVVDFYDKYAEGWFVENPHPCPYLTVAGDGKTDETIIKEIETSVASIQTSPHAKHGKLRLTYPHDSDLRVMVRSLSEKYGISIKPSRLANKERLVKLNKAFTSRADEAVHLDKGTITRLLRERVPDDFGLVSDMLTEVEGRL